MARSPKSSENTEKPETSHKNAAETPDMEAGHDSSDNPESTEPESGDAKEESPVVVEAEAVDVTGEDAGGDDAEEPHAAETGPETSPGGDAISTPVPTGAHPSRSAFIPMLLGGLAAGVIGFLVAGFAPVDWRSGADDAAAEAIRSNAERIADLTGRIEQIGAQEPVDLAGIEGQIAGLSDQSASLSRQIDGLRDELTADLSILDRRVTAYESRLRALEEQPERGDGSAARAAAAQTELEAFRAQLDQLIADAESRVRAAEARAADIEQAAEAATADAERQADLAELRATVESGAGFSEVLARFGDAPKGLTGLSVEGVPTMVSLQQSFPDAARAALAASQTVPEDASAGERLAAFLKRQTNARSLIPRDGSDPDAVLSRAEASLNQGDLDTALSEVSTLPDAARAAMSGWLERAETRASAMKALDELSAVTN